MHTDYLLLALPWVAYCSAHSALIAIPVNGLFQRLLGPRYRFYRLLYNLFSVSTLVPLVLYSHSARWKTGIVFAWAGYLWIVQWSLIALAVVLAIAGARHYSLRQFLGIQQLRGDGSRGAMTHSGQFNSSGVLGVVRHPWYAAVFILLWTRDLNMAEITISVVLSAYLIIGTALEERKLILEFGDDYRDYQSRVPMFVPLKWLSRWRKRAATHS